MACRPGWEKNIGILRDKHDLERDYYDCGKYYFDGMYNVVEFPKGMSVYHGSVDLAVANLEFPLSDFYTKKQHFNDKQRHVLRATPNNQAVNKEAFEYVFDNNPVNGWFGHYELAQEYASNKGKYGGAKGKYCGSSCVYAYKLKTNIKLLLMSDEHNLGAILMNEKLSPDEQKAYHTDYNLKGEPTQNDGFDPRNRIDLNYYITSSRATGYLTPTALCRISKLHGYDGWGHFRTPQKGGHVRIAEIVTCNPKKIFERDTDNPLDWQHNSTAPPDGIKQIIKSMKQYQTSNMDFHGGSPYHHSVWTALWTEVQILNNSRWWVQAKTVAQHYKVTDFLARLEKLSVFAAFIHDIGKFGDGIKWFYDKPDHPKVGGEYVSGKRDFMLSDTKTVKLTDLLKGYDADEQKYIAWIAAGHYDFGNSLRSEHITRDIAVTCLDKMCKRLKQFGLKFDKDIHAILMILSLINISVADVRATAPPPMINDIDRVHGKLKTAKDMKKKIDWNYKSIYHPYISNVAKQFRGKDAYKVFDYDSRGIMLYDLILQYIDHLTEHRFDGRKLITHYKLT